MAMTSFGTNDAQTVSIWAKRTAREALKSTLVFKKFLGTGPRAIIERRTDLEKTAGDTIKYDLLMQAKAAGVTGKNRLKDNEEALTYYQDTVIIDQLRNAHSFDRMSQQRTIHSLRKDASLNLGEWFADKFESYMFRALCGDTSLTHGQTAVAPDSAHQVFCGNQATEAAVVSNTEQITLDELDYAKEKAITNSPPMRPVRIDGGEYFVAVLHPYSITDLRLNLGSSSNAKWMEIQQYANKRGKDNPIFTGAEGLYNGIIIYSSHHIYSPIANCRRNLLLGAQAGVFAVGNAYEKMDQSKMGKENMYSWYEESDDYGNEKGIAVGSIFGMKKTRFNSADYGTMVISSYATSKR